MRFLITLLLFTFTSFACQAQSFSVIRDAEIENYMAEWFTPIYKSAGLNSRAVNVVLISNDQVNAFVSGGSNMFFFTGLLTETESAEEVIGVFAHELGHITGGHLVRAREAQRYAMQQAIVSSLIGFGAAILGGGNAAGAAIGGGQALAATGFLAHSRVQESSADQAAISYMNGAGLDPEGFVSFLRKLENQELLPASQQIEYVRTHPVTANRIENVLGRIEQLPKAHIKKSNPKWEEQHARMKAKLIGFLTPNRVIYTYPDYDTSIAAQYARAIAAYRKNQFDQAESIMNALLNKEPENPYFHEFLGQIYRDKGDLTNAIKSYKTADRIIPNTAMIKLSLAHVYLEETEKNNRGNANESINLLKQALIIEPRMSFAYRLLARAYGYLGQNALAKLYLAEEGLIKGDLEYARRQTESALKEIDEDSPDYLRAKDLLNLIKKKQDEKN